MTSQFWTRWTNPNTVRKQQVCRQQQKQATHPCLNGGNSWPHPGVQQHCPARDVTCTRCHKLNHFAKWCEGGRNNRPGTLVPRPPKSREQRVSQLDNACDYAYFINASNYNVVLRHARMKVENVELNQVN